jgi:hypothetical protein
MAAGEGRDGAQQPGKPGKPHVEGEGRRAKGLLVLPTGILHREPRSPIPGTSGP